MPAITPEQQITNVFRCASSQVFDIRLCGRTDRVDDLIDTVRQLYVMWHQHLEGELKPIEWDEIRGQDDTEAK